MRELEEQVGTAPVASGQSANSVCTVLSRCCDSQRNDYNDTFSTPAHDDATKEREVSHKRLCLGTSFDQTESPHGEDKHPKQSLVIPLDTLETTYLPAEKVSSSEPISPPDPSTLWNFSTPFPTPNEGTLYPVFDNAWPNTKSICDPTHQCLCPLNLRCARGAKIGHSIQCTGN